MTRAFSRGSHQHIFRVILFDLHASRSNLDCQLHRKAGTASAGQPTFSTCTCKILSWELKHCTPKHLQAFKLPQVVATWPSGRLRRQLRLCSAGSRRSMALFANLTWMVENLMRSLLVGFIELFLISLRIVLVLITISI